jgi:acyl-CoA reductase-like NAD-dependent aldehyde dehydrogenase
MTMDDHSAAHRVMTDQEENLGVRSDGLHLSPQQRARIVRANFQTSKHDAAELATLAKELREELNKPNAKAASLEVLNRVEKIQKLAKKIREETKGF